MSKNGNTMSKKIKNMWHSATKNMANKPSLKKWIKNLKNDESVVLWVKNKLELNRSTVPASTRESIRAERAIRRRSKKGSGAKSKVTVKKASTSFMDD